ncbi:hypothetical protein LNKW23_38860 [Paralimibaculum aggregatum]|uniref:ABM domain-containing protein n=1 Tax=Paralimibaculum aggregatum TaxID=3036245 RepID=A0ABQ6LS91_9RHOB|nr:antibiotic biosynthesis monooxygenase [Limibaculum sp. NKW23]GMG84670.1 hypothetical protein LNKW23_38860 [Limibaculum sp. NKW23]
MILRIFRAVVQEGQQAAFRDFIENTALPLTRRQDGLVSVTISAPHAISPNEFSMVSVWRDLDALKAFTGESWQEAVVLPEEAHLLAASHLHHYEVLATEGPA